MRRATVAAAITATAALAIVPAWTGATGEKQRARNVIVLQGDGMGTAQRDLIRLVTAGNTPGAELHMNRLEHGGLVHTDPADPEAGRDRLGGGGDRVRHRA